MGEPIKLSGTAAKRVLPEHFREIEEQFAGLQASVCVPLLTKSGLVGIMVLGEKKGKGYTDEDFELLETLANQSAMAIQNLKLQENLRESKELESFHKFSSFVIHDLRNTVSILSMLSENARENMENPDFRKDLIKTLSGSVDNMQGLLARISMRSNHSRVLLEEIDLCEWMRKSLEDIKLSSQLEIKFKCQEIPKLLSDSSQLKRVIVNLVLNAKDAMPNGGHILLKASKGKANALPANIRSNWLPPAFIEISIADNGCGMTEDFIKNSLFRPFRTTKDNGLGIGLYHSKEIVEMLGGRIWVQSTVGSGSTFYVALPIKEDLTKREFSSHANLAGKSDSQ